MAICWASVDAIADEAARRVAEIEAAGELPADLVASITDAGLFRLGLPSEWGGHEAPPEVWFQVVRRLAWGDGSVGWVIGAATSFHEVVAAGAHPALQHQLFEDRRAHLAGGVNGAGTARAVAGGFEVAGRWGFASGCRSAAWLGGLCVDTADGAGATGGTRMVVVPATRAEIVASWDAIGLRGTGSHTVVLPPQVVPAEWTFPFPYPLDHVTTARPPLALAARGLWPTAFALAATQLGIARRALDEVAAFARGKHRSTAALPLVEEQSFARDLARAEGAWRAALRGAEQVVAELRTHAAGDRLDLEHRLEARLIATHAAQVGAAVVRTCFDVAGAGVIGQGHPVARCLRDGTLLAHHAVVTQRTYDLMGRVATGVVGDSPFI